jgi:hypothetical protein
MVVCVNVARGRGVRVGAGVSEETAQVFSKAVSVNEILATPINAMTVGRYSGR